MSTDERRLLVIVLKGHRRLESILEGFLELELPGATVLDARGMGELVTSEIPVFSGFRSLFGGASEESYMLLSVLTPDRIEEALALVRDVCGDFAEAGAGVAFTLPVLQFLGPRRD